MGNMMHIVGIDHVQLAMPAGREDDARTFYDQLLKSRRSQSLRT